MPSPKNLSRWAVLGKAEITVGAAAGAVTRVADTGAIDNATGYDAGIAAVDIDGIGNLSNLYAGDTFTVAGHSTEYTITADVAVSSNEVSGLAFSPSLTEDVVDNAVVSFKVATLSVDGIDATDVASGTAFLIDGQDTIYRVKRDAAFAAANTAVRVQLAPALGGVLADDAEITFYTYGVDAKPTATADGILVESRPSVNYEYLFDGARGNTPGGGVPALSAGRTGRKANYTAETVGFGANAAYTATVRPAIHSLLVAAGMKDTFVAARSALAGTPLLAGAIVPGDDKVRVDGLDTGTARQGDVLTIGAVKHTIMRDVTFTAAATAEDVYVSPSISVAAADNTAVSFDAVGAKVIYRPSLGLDGEISSTYHVYDRGQLFKVRGAYADSFTFAFEGPVAPLFNAGIVGIGGVPEDAVVPMVTSYPDASIVPPRAENTNLHIDGKHSGFVLRSGSFEMNREIADRPDSNIDGGYQGLTPGGRAPVLQLSMESTALSSLNPYDLSDSGKVFGLFFEVGDMQYNRWKFFGPNVQLSELTEGEDGPSALWDMSFGLRPTSYQTTDEFSIIFD